MLTFLSIFTPQLCSTSVRNGALQLEKSISSLIVQPADGGIE